MLIAILFAGLVTSAHNGTRNFEECKAQDFKSKTCWESKQLWKAGKFLCKVQGKPYDGSSDCKVEEVAVAK